MWTPYKRSYNSGQAPSRPGHSPVQYHKVYMRRPRARPVHLDARPLLLVQFDDAALGETLRNLRLRRIRGQPRHVDARVLLQLEPPFLRRPRASEQFSGTNTPAKSCRQTQDLRPHTRAPLNCCAAKYQHVARLCRTRWQPPSPSAACCAPARRRRPACACQRPAAWGRPQHRHPPQPLAPRPPDPAHNVPPVQQFPWQIHRCFASSHLRSDAGLVARQF